MDAGDAVRVERVDPRLSASSEQGVGRDAENIERSDESAVVRNLHPSHGTVPGVNDGGQAIPLTRRYFLRRLGFAVGVTPADNAAGRDPSVSAAPAVMLASYTWGQVARRWAALPHPERGRVALAHLARVHPQFTQPDIVRRTASWSWDTHPWSAGAFAWFTPGQHVALHRHIVAPEGRIYFAGEHASLTHAWMQGALESALVAVREILAAESR